MVNPELCHACPLNRGTGPIVQFVGGRACGPLLDGPNTFSLAVDDSGRVSAAFYPEAGSTEQELMGRVQSCDGPRSDEGDVRVCAALGPYAGARTEVVREILAELLSKE